MTNFVLLRPTGLNPWFEPTHFRLLVTCSYYSQRFIQEQAKQRKKHFILLQILLLAEEAERVIHTEVVVNN